MEDKDLKSVLNSAGSNREEIQRVLDHYSLESNDSLRLKAAIFLLKNMKSLYTLKYSVKKTKDSLKPSSSNDLRYELDSYTHDIQTIKASFLIANIDHAYEAWKSNATNDISFEEFCEFMVPYRTSYESVENWRSIITNQKAFYLDGIDRGGNQVRVFNAIYTKINDRMGYKPALSRTPNYRNYSELSHERGGDCYDITRFTIFVMRALGYAVTLDYTPAWINNNGGHYWNVALDNHVFKMFHESKVSDSVYRLYYKPSKVFRKVATIQSPYIPIKFKNIKGIPSHLFTADFIDVTNEYEKTLELCYKPSNKVQTNNTFLTVFNKRYWTPIQYSTTFNNNQFAFTNVVPDGLYRIYTVDADSLKPITDIFLYTKKKQTRYFNPDYKNLIDLHLEYERYPDTTWTTYKTEFGIKANKDYELYYWDKDWKLFTKIKSSNQGLIEIKGIPSRTLYLLTRKNFRNYERPFSIQNGSMAWW